MVAAIVARLIGGAILATGGLWLGDYISSVWGPQLWVPWVFGLTVGGAIIGVTTTPYISVRTARLIAKQFEGTDNSRILSGIVGLALGLLVALLFSIQVSRIPGWPGVALPIALSVFLAYLGTYLMSSPERDLFSGLIHNHGPGYSGKNGSNGNSATGSDSTRNGRMLLDTSAIIDGRIADISQTGFVQGTFLIPSFILDEVRHIADSSDALRRTRGRRGLEILNKLRRETDVPIEVIDVESLNGQEVDAKLVEMGKDLHASIITTDYNLNRVAQIHGVPVLNVNELASSLKPVVIPGEGMVTRIVQEGKEPGQGVGFLDDGTMIVVEGGNRHINEDVDVLVTRVLQTAAGSIIFAQPKRQSA